MQTLQIFSERIKHLRENKQVTQFQIAEVLGCTEQHYQKIEYGKINTSLLKLVDLANYHAVSIDYLTGRTDNPEVNK